MTIEKVHGLHATSITLNDRFTLLAEAPLPRVLRSKRRSVSQSLSNKSFNFQNRNLIQQIAYHLEQANRQAVKQRLGLRRYGSESSLPGLRRSNSTGNLNQWGIKNRLSWRQSNGNLSQANSFNNLVTGMFRGRGFRRRGARMGLARGRMRGRGGRQMVGRLRQAGAQAQRGRATGGRRARGRGRGGGGRGVGAGGRGVGAGGRGVGAGGGRRGGAGGAVAAAKPIPTKEELDLQLDQYMASTRWALDKQLDAYMDSAMSDLQ